MDVKVKGTISCELIDTIAAVDLVVVTVVGTKITRLY